jgi:hypothetical protein
MEDSPEKNTDPCAFDGGLGHGSDPRAECDQHGKFHRV